MLKNKIIKLESDLSSFVRWDCAIEQYAVQEYRIRYETSGEFEMLVEQYTIFSILYFSRSMTFMVHLL